VIVRRKHTIHDWLSTMHTSINALNKRKVLKAKWCYSYVHNNQSLSVPRENYVGNHITPEKNVQTNL